MIRVFLILVGLFVLGACAGGTQYSSQRAQVPQTNIVPMPPAPRTAPVLTEPVAITPGATPVLDAPAQTAVLAGPVAITPGAVPVADTPTSVLASARPVVPATAPALSLKPPVRAVAPRAERTAAAAPVATPVKAVSRPKPTRARKAVVRRRASGPIYNACMSAGRKAATTSRCSCVQRVADKELTGAQQRRGAGYFRNQQKLQDVRQSDSSANEAFWTAWKAYGQAAARQCRNS